MKPTFKILLFASIVCIISLFACKEETGDTPAPDTRTKVQLILASPWKWSTSTCNVPVDKDGKDGASTDILSQYPPCYSDGTYTFKADSTYTVANNVKCKSNEASSYKGPWIFTNSETIIKWNNFDFTLVELSGSKLVVKYSETVGSETYVITDTYIH